MRTRNNTRFTIRSILFVATFVAIALAWPRSGARIGPIALQFLLGAVLTCWFFRHRERAAIAFRRCVLLLAVLFLFYLSFGPASGAHARYLMPKLAGPNSRWTAIDTFASKTFRYIYKPVAISVIFLPEPVRDWSIAYVAWWMPRNVEFCDWGDGMGWRYETKTHAVSHTVVRY